MRRLFATISLLAAALTVPAAAASAQAAPGSATAVTTLKNVPDNGHGTPSEWAVDTMQRTVTVTRGSQAPAADCELSSGTCWSYSAKLTDLGTFVTKPGAGTPNQACAGCAGEQVKTPAQSGYLTGTYSITFYASSGSPRPSLVPRMHDDHGVAASAPFTSTSWPQLFFPAGTHFSAMNGGAYSWTYLLVKFSFPFLMQQWVDSSTNNDGNAPGDGNITG